MRRLSYIIFLLLCATWLWVSCSDDDYTTSTSTWLTIGTDTIFFDTVFSNVPSAAQDFWVYNKSKSHVRLTSIAQQRGNQSGFRVNVDGIYLGQTTGYQTSEVEIRAGDSIRVFVELTSYTQGTDAPQMVEDNIVFTLESGNVQRVNLRAFSWDAIILTDPVISENTTYTPEKPIVIYGGLTVEPSATLTLEAGTTLYMRDDTQIKVYGTLLALGEPQNEVVLRGYRMDNMFDYLPYDRVSGQWEGIHFFESSYDNRLEFTDLHSAFTGIEIDSADVNRSKLVLNCATVHNCQGYGIVSRASSLELYDCQISNALDDCCYIDGGNVEINNSTFAQFYPYDAQRGVAFRFSSATAPTNISCINSLITGYANDELQLGLVEEDVQYQFDDCIIRVVEDESIDTLRFVRTRFENEEDSINGKGHFVEFDATNFIYDFNLVAASPCVDTANPLTALPIDREGRLRDEFPDIGAYEYIKQEE